MRPLPYFQFSGTIEPPEGSEEKRWSHGYMGYRGEDQGMRVRYIKADAAEPQLSQISGEHRTLSSVEPPDLSFEAVRQFYVQTEDGGAKWEVLKDLLETWPISQVLIYSCFEEVRNFLEQRFKETSAMNSLRGKADPSDQPLSPDCVSVLHPPVDDRAKTDFEANRDAVLRGWRSGQCRVLICGDGVLWSAEG